MRIEKTKVGLAQTVNRRQNIHHALDLVQEEIIPKLTPQVMLKPNFLSNKNQLASTHVDAIRGTIDFLLPAVHPSRPPRRLHVLRMRCHVSLPHHRL